MTATIFIAIFMVKYRIEYLLAMPFVFGLFCFYLWISFKPDSAVQKPEKLYREKKLIAYIAVLCVILFVLTFVDLDFLNFWMDPFLLPAGGTIK